MTARLQIRSMVYRDRPGFTVTGPDALGRSIRIFVRHRATAEAIRDVIRADGPDREAEIDRLIREEAK